MPLMSERHARVAELADAQASGACVLRDVGVQVPPRAQHAHPALRRGVPAFHDRFPTIDRWPIWLPAPKCRINHLCHHR